MSNIVAKYANLGAQRPLNLIECVVVPIMLNELLTYKFAKKII